MKNNNRNSPLSGIKLFNRPQQKSLRRELRKNLTLAEQKLWAKIRNKQLGRKFRRQHGIGRYIVDFYCPECALVIELDGDSHYVNGAQEYDHIRDEFIQAWVCVCYVFPIKTS